MHLCSTCFPNSLLTVSSSSDVDSPISNCSLRLEQFLLFPGLPNLIAEKVLLQRGFDLETAAQLALKLGPNLPRILQVPLADPFEYVQSELYMGMTNIKGCLALNTTAGAGSAVEKASAPCCNAFQTCLLARDILLYSPRFDELRFSSPLSLNAFNLVAQSSPMALGSPLQWDELA